MVRSLLPGPVRNALCKCKDAKFKDRGFLKVGQAADIIATPANPPKKVETLKQVVFVMKNGTVIER